MLWRPSPMAPALNAASELSALPLAVQLCLTSFRWHNWIGLDVFVLPPAVSCWQPAWRRWLVLVQSMCGHILTAASIIAPPISSELYLGCLSAQAPPLESDGCSLGRPAPGHPLCSGLHFGPRLQQVISVRLQRKETGPLEALRSATPPTWAGRRTPSACQRVCPLVNSIFAHQLRSLANPSIAAAVRTQQQTHPFSHASWCACGIIRVLRSCSVITPRLSFNHTGLQPLPTSLAGPAALCAFASSRSQHPSGAPASKSQLWHRWRCAGEPAAGVGGRSSWVNAGAGALLPAFQARILLPRPTLPSPPCATHGKHSDGTFVHSQCAGAHPCSLLRGSAAHPSHSSVRMYAWRLRTQGFTVNSVPTKPIEGQKTGTSGLRKKTKVFMSENYLANW